MNLIITAEGAPYEVKCLNQSQRDAVIEECVRDGYEFRDAVDADDVLESVDFFDWNPA